MTEQPIKRNRYFDPPTFECDVNGRNLDEDIQNFHLLSSQAHLASLQDWGIAQGLEVSGTLGSNIITINPGVALDAQGRLIVLASEGRGDLGNNPPGGGHDPVPVPVELNTNDFAEDSYYLTIQFSEILRFDDGGNDCGRLEQTPWLRLQPVSGFTDDGTAVVLAVVTVDSVGNIVSLTHQDISTLLARHLTSKTVGELQIRRSQIDGNEIQETNAGKLEALPNGGLQLSVTNTNDQILLNQVDGSNFSSFSVQADTFTTSGNVGIGTTAPIAKLEVTGDLRLEAGVAVNEFSSDGTFSSNSELAVPTERAVKTYVDGEIATALLTKAALNGSPTQDFQTRNLTVNENLTTTGSLDVGGDLRLRGAEIRDAGGTSRITLTDNGRLDLKEDGGSTVLTVATNGFVGIGTTSPTSRLNVNGNIDVTGDIRLRGRDIRDAGNTPRITINDNGRLDLKEDNGAVALSITTNRRVGIGTTDPRTSLHVLERISTGRDFQSAGAITFFPPDGFAWFHIDNGPAGGRPIGRLRISHGSQPGDNEIISILQNRHVGIGVSSPVARLHVQDSINASAALTNHVAVFENTSTGASADVLALRVRTISPGSACNFITFKSGDRDVGSIEGTGNNNIRLRSGSGDYAEYLPRLNEEEVIEPGEIVGVFGGKVTKYTQGADHVMAITNQPIVLGKAPQKQEQHLYEQVAFLGQVPIKILGNVQSGDYIIPSGFNDGIGIAVSPHEIAATQFDLIVGRAWETSEQEGVKQINAVISLNSNSHWFSSLLQKMQIQQSEIKILKNQIQELKSPKGFPVH